MIKLERQQTLGIVRVAINEHPTPDELETVVTNLDEIIKREHIERLLFCLGHHYGIHAEALIAEVLIRHWAAGLDQTPAAHPFPERIAFVGDEIWHTWATEIIRPVLLPEVRFYTPPEDARARSWLQEGGGAT